MLRQEASYKQDVVGIAGNVIRDEVELAITRVKKWAPMWGTEKLTITPKDMWGDVLEWIESALPSLRHKVQGVKKWKDQGHDTYYKFDLWNRLDVETQKEYKKEYGGIPIDEAIKMREEEVQNAEDAPYIDIGED